MAGVETVARAVAEADRHFQVAQNFEPAVAEGGGVTDTVVISGFEKLHHAAVQEIEIRYVGVRARFRGLHVPRPEDVLIAVAEPEPQQVRAVPGRHDRLKITFQLLVGVGFGEHRVAVGERHGAAPRVAGSELDRYGSAGVAPIGGDMFDAERGERFVERVGKVLDARFRDCAACRTDRTRACRRRGR